MATEVDATCGRIIKELKRQGVFDKSLIVFTTDNGNMHGEHGLAEKCEYLISLQCQIRWVSSSVTHLQFISSQGSLLKNQYECH